MTFGVFSRLLQVFLCHGLEGEQFSILDCESAGIKMRRDYLEGWDCRLSHEQWNVCFMTCIMGSQKIWFKYKEIRCHSQSLSVAMAGWLGVLVLPLWTPGLGLRKPNHRLPAEWVDSSQELRTGNTPLLLTGAAPSSPSSPHSCCSTQASWNTETWNRPTHLQGCSFSVFLSPILPTYPNFSAALTCPSVWLT